ncbi:hypothetical protein [Advenella mimigardefordensis]|uniref:hypothetical protein n=1 Tax=Advenella mimigardefordensis TaxID=302406 RepID=UPI00130E9241|nr:hypothetical protein [Advenella mimigardefordensis]
MPSWKAMSWKAMSWKASSWKATALPANPARGCVHALSLPAPPSPIGCACVSPAGTPEQTTLSVPAQIDH